MQSAVQHGEKEGKLFLIVCTVFLDYDNNVRSGDYHIKRLAACLVVGPLPSGFLLSNRATFCCIVLGLYAFHKLCTITGVPVPPCNSYRHVRVTVSPAQIWVYCR